MTWQPISTAPRDVTILARSADGATVTPSRWIEKDQRWNMFTVDKPPTEWKPYEKPNKETPVKTLPIRLADLAATVIRDFPAALRDDPTAWPNDDATLVSEVETAVREVVRDNYRSLLARTVGPHIQAAATAMDVALAEDGPLADLADVWSGFVADMDLEDYSTIAAAKDWDARVEALSDLVAQRLAAMPVPSPARADLDAYVASDPRLGALAVSQKHGAAQPFTAPEPEPAKGFSWDDEDEAPAPTPTPAPTTPPVNDTRPMPLLFTMCDAIGLIGTDIAEITGINKSVISNARNGKRPWQGLTEKQAHKLADEIEARIEASRDLAARLRSLDPAVVDSNRL